MSKSKLELEHTDGGQQKKISISHETELLDPETLERLQKIDSRIVDMYLSTRIKEQDHRHAKEIRDHKFKSGSILLGTILAVVAISGLVICAIYKQTEVALIIGSIFVPAPILNAIAGIIKNKNKSE